jgi:hypothetical protein
VTGCKRCNAVVTPPPPFPTAAAPGGRRCHTRPPAPPTPACRRSRRRRRTGSGTRAPRLPAARRGRACGTCLRSNHCKPAHGIAAVQRRDAIAQPQRASDRTRQSIGRLPLLLRTSVRPPASSTTRAAYRRPTADATSSALAPRLSARCNDAACEQWAHTHNRPPPAAPTPHARQLSCRHAARPRHARRARPQTASHRLAAAATGDITCRCVTAAWAGRPTARGMR